MFEQFFIPFLAIGLAELGDKTQLAIICLSSKTDRHLRLLMGVMLAFIIADGGAIILGSYLTSLFPSEVIRFVSGIVFLLFGILTLLNKKEETADCDIRRPFITGFSMILISEMGDKTQIAAALFGARYDTIPVFLGVISALFILSAAAILVGKVLMCRLNRRAISKAAGTVFVIIGTIFILGG